MANRQVTIDDYPIGAVQVDETLENFAAAQDMLDTLARNAQPILKRRGWKVVKLTEIKPVDWKRHKNVLGWCQPRGDSCTSDEIRIQLRFLPKMAIRPFESLMGTMLHELSHIVHSQHRAPFYKLMDELKEEWTQLVTEGKVLDANGFPVSGGRRLGGRLESSANPRGKKLGGFGGCGHRLGRGGSASWARLSKRERAARAAERRAADAAQGFDDEELWPGIQEGMKKSAAVAEQLNLVGDWHDGVASRARSAVTPSISSGAASSSGAATAPGTAAPAPAGRAGAVSASRAGAVSARRAGTVAANRPGATPISRAGAAAASRAGASPDSKRHRTDTIGRSHVETGQTEEEQLALALAASQSLAAMQAEDSLQHALQESREAASNIQIGTDSQAGDALRRALRESREAAVAQQRSTENIEAAERRLLEEATRLSRRDADGGVDVDEEERQLRLAIDASMADSSGIPVLCVD